MDMCPGPQLVFGCPAIRAPWPPAHHPSFAGVWLSGSCKYGCALAKGNSSIQCSSPPPARFYVNLLCSEEPGSDAALHFNPRLDESTVVFNSLERGTWGAEERGSGIPFQRGQPFDVLLIATEDGFKVRLFHRGGF